MIVKPGAIAPEIAEGHFQRVSYTTINGGCGVGRLIGDRVFRKRSDGHYVPAMGVAGIFRDGGKMYLEELDRRLSTVRAIDGAADALMDELNRG